MRVLVVASDSVRSILVLFGSARVGAVHVGANWRWTAEELAHVLRDAAPGIVFADPDFLPVLCQAKTLSGTGAPLVSLSHASGDLQAWDEWLGSERPGAPAHSPHRDDPVVQLYTSGTTGHPKGVVLANRSFFAITDEVARSQEPWIGWTDEDVSLLPIPCFHIGGLWWLVRGLAFGSTNIVLGSFDASRVLTSIPKYRVTKTCMVPAMMQVVLTEPECESTDFSSLRTLVYGGAPMAPVLLEKARRVFGCELCQIYGLTETGNMAVCFRRAERADSERLLAAGLPLPGVQVRVLDGDGRELPPGVVGEIAIHSPARMLEYYKAPAATRATLQDGWILTGDGGYQDDDGHVYICDRIKDMLICAGENVYPAEIERVLRSHSAVADAAVIGVPDELWGEAGLAFVILRAGAQVTPRELSSHTRGQLAEFKIPRRIEFVTELPRNASGKLLKGKLRDAYWRGRPRQVN
jgi:acyl-CoA synthetase (AMP-forming)/AMP-acid ligase II